MFKLENWKIEKFLQNFEEMNLKIRLFSIFLVFSSIVILPLSLFIVLFLTECIDPSNEYLCRKYPHRHLATVTENIVKKGYCLYPPTSTCYYGYSKYTFGSDFCYFNDFSSTSNGTFTKIGSTNWISSINSDSSCNFVNVTDKILIIAALTSFGFLIIIGIFITFFMCRKLYDDYQLERRSMYFTV